MQWLYRGMNRVDAIFAVLAEVALFGLMALIMVSVAGRTLFAASVPDGQIITEIVMAAMVFLTLGNAQRLGEHIEVTALAKLLPERVNSALQVCALVLGIMIFGGSAWFSARTAFLATQSDELFFSSLLDIRVWPALWLVPLGFLWWSLRMFIQIAVPESRPDTVDRLQEVLDKFD